VRTGEVNTLVPVASLELPPAASYRRHPFFPPLSPSDPWGHSVRRARGLETDRGPRAGAGRAALLGRAVASAGARVAGRSGGLAGPVVR
jgi:hypothetical protein